MYNDDVEWRVVFERDPKSGDWAVWCPELPGCASAGETLDEAETNIREAIRLYLTPLPIKLRDGAVVKKLAVQ